MHLTRLHGDFSLLNSIHETALHLVKHHDTNTHQHNHKYKAVCQHAPTEGTYSHQTVFECLNNGGHRVDGHNPLFVGWHGA